MGLSPQISHRGDLANEGGEQANGGHAPHGMVFNFSVVLVAASTAQTSSPPVIAKPVKGMSAKRGRVSRISQSRTTARACLAGRPKRDLVGRARIGVDAFGDVVDT